MINNPASKKRTTFSRKIKMLTSVAFKALIEEESVGDAILEYLLANLFRRPEEIGD